MNSLEFDTQRISGALALTPIIDGTSLTSLVEAFETDRGFSPVGGYGGLMPAFHNFGDLRRYYMGHDNGAWPKVGRLWVLACECGEAGCWPLEAGVAVLDDRVIWSDFSNPHRPVRDYRMFGPFEFSLAQYEAAVNIAVTSVGS